ncbi:DUF5340 domain-containing protein [Leptolyngbya sp. FACHB-261]|uniref:DUF5340 domain-containing protein n=1 Tax=Leptolyngbya sp. FACHB-261 TaxID=2692806 RepID=UPI0016897EA0|nr:DUF5340 domain-containing protein [Leptolyngbya sp. FACHB-261]MBD2103757.1 DUF5340 domain-containing protein [Leptolyngbya sp. FACHB-261]
MQSIPIPSHVHYELLLRLLERQTLPAAARDDASLREQVQQLIITLRKAAAQQKQIEANCQQRGLELDYRWSLNGAIGVNGSLKEGISPVNGLTETVASPEMPGSI